MQSKILVTGGSGFIGTNIIEDLLNDNYEVLNIDIVEPKIKKRMNIWKKIDITDYNSLNNAIKEFEPDYLIHLAARTDLDGNNIEDYEANTIGVQNLMKVIKEVTTLKKVIITSSKFVTKNGYKIKNQFDYCPHTKYGESKVISEKEVWKNEPDCDWCIIRPTSIWGPYFGEPYRNFFDIVVKKMYFHFGKIKCYKTYGYIGNAIYQIKSLLFNETKDRNNKVFYIGDEPAYEINEWADEIAKELGYKVHTVPVFFIKILAKIGDFLKIFKIHFPMQSFRFYNMTHDCINDMSNTYKYAPNNPYTRIEGTKITLKWMKRVEKI